LVTSIDSPFYLRASLAGNPLRARMITAKDRTRLTTRMTPLYRNDAERANNIGQ